MKYLVEVKGRKMDDVENAGCAKNLQRNSVCFLLLADDVAPILANGSHGNHGFNWIIINY